MLKLRQVLLTSGDSKLTDAVSTNFMNLEARIVDVPELLAWQGAEAPWIFVDWLLPLMAGIQLVMLLRQAAWGSRARIVMTLPANDDAMRERALAAGADDYLVGPLTAEALIDRLRIYQGAMDRPADPILRMGQLSVDTNAFSAAYDGSAIPLTGTEFRLLAHFVRSPNKVFSRGDLIGVLGKNAAITNERTVDVWISRLRQTLEKAGVPHLPRTVRSFGFILDTVTPSAIPKKSGRSRRANEVPPPLHLQGDAAADIQPGQPIQFLNAPPSTQALSSDDNPESASTQ
ncbi:MAG: response regulator transcription factor [Novosphingobium sp.]